MEASTYPLLTRQLAHSEIRQLIAEQESNLSRYLGRYAQQQIIARITPNQCRLLKHNYQAIINHLNKSHININNLSMHLLTTLHLYYRALSMHAQAKDALKKTLAYIENPHSDPIMQGICLNHLANLYKSRGKVWKSLKYSLKGVQMVQAHLHQSKGLSKQDKQQIAVLLVVLLIFAKNCLTIVMRKNQSKTFRHYYQFVNYLGYKNCTKYLGKQSVFNQFSSTDKFFHLPVFKTEVNREEKKENSREAEIIGQLEKICDILKSKQNPEFVVINTQSNLSEPRVDFSQAEHSIFINNQIQEVIIQQKPQPSPPPPPQPALPLPLPAQPDPPKVVAAIKQEKQAMPNIIEQLFRPFAAQKQPDISIPKITINQKSIDHETSHHYVPSQDGDDSEEESLPPLVMAEETISLNRWEIKFRLQKQQAQRVGNLHIECSNKRQIHKEVIAEQKLEKILCQINREDKLSYEIINEDLVEEEFIQHYVKPFFSISDHGKIAIHPRSTGLLQPYQIKFLSKDCFVFFNHIRHNLFRVAISPIYSCKSIYLNVELSQPTMVQFFSFQQQTVDFINAIFKSINNSPSIAVPLTIKDKNKLCKITNQQGFLKYINQVVVEFQNALLNREDQTAVNEIIQNELLYYKYEQVSKNKLGIYYFIRYLPSINYFDVYLKNNYETYAIDGKIKSRGNALYKAQDFLQDFGIPLKASKKNLFAYLEIIAKKYYLLTFDKPLTDHDNDRYVQNAILDLPITENCFRTRLVRKDGYLLPTTISLLTINSETPVGIKVIEYDPISCRSRGFFIHIVAKEWVRPYRRPVVTINNVLFHTYINEFPFRSEYFLPEWLEKNGFATLFEKIGDPASQLYLEHNINCLVRGKILIRIFNNDDSS